MPLLPPPTAPSHPLSLPSPTSPSTRQPIHHLNPGWVALIGATILVIAAAPHDASAVLHAVEWDMLLFFAGEGGGKPAQGNGMGVTHRRHVSAYRRMRLLTNGTGHAFAGCLCVLRSHAPVLCLHLVLLTALLSATLTLALPCAALPLVAPPRHVHHGGGCCGAGPHAPHRLFHPHDH